MNFAWIGALAAGVCVACAALARQPVVIPALRIRHPDMALLKEIRWSRGLLTWELVRLGSAVTGSVLGAAVGFVPALLLAALVAPSLSLRVAAARRRERVGRDTVGLLQFVHASLRSGAATPEALRFAVSATSAESGRPFARALRDFDLGAPLDDALRASCGEEHDRRVVLALDALALGVGEQLPASRFAGVLGSAIDRLLFEQRLLDEVRARTSGLRLQVILLAVLVPSLALYLVLTMPGLAQTLGTPLGKFVLVPLALLLELAGILASRRVISSVS